ncbi:MAG: hypothetical protein ACI9EW_002523 [Cellvibrionaceae bacterium]|jgi:hypothetical protein
MTDPQHPANNRRDRRRRERQTFLSMTSIFIIALLSGIGVAIWLSWTVFPLNPPVGSPAVFRDDFRRDYLYMVSESLSQTGDWDKAKARLDLLQAADLPQTIVQELENYLREGRSAEDVRHMARLAQGLGAEGAALDLFAPTPAEPIAELSALNTPTRAAAFGGGETAEVATATPTLLPTPTSIVAPTSTPIPIEEIVNSQLAYQLVSQEEVCILNAEEGEEIEGKTEKRAAIEIEVFVQNINSEGVAGEEILVSWDTGTDRFVTGLKREVGAGYADFTMSAGVSYSAELVSGSNRVGGLVIGSCADGAGQTGWRLVFEEVVSGQ